MLDELVDLLEGIFIKKKVDALSSGELSISLLTIETLFTGISMTR